MLTETILLEQNKRLRERNEELEETIRQLQAVDAKPLPADVPYLTRIEEKVFRSLLRHEGGYISQETILAAMYQMHGGGDSQSVRHFIGRLRRKLQGSPYGVKTMWGRGYQLIVAVPATQVNETLRDHAETGVSSNSEHQPA